MNFFPRWASAVQDDFYKLKRWASFRDGLLFKNTLANSRGGLLPETGFFSRTLLQTQQVSFFLRRASFREHSCKLYRWASFWDGLLFENTLANSTGELLFETGFFSRTLLQTQQVSFFSRRASFREHSCKLKRWASFRDRLLFENTRENSRGGLLF